MMKRTRRKEKTTDTRATAIKRLEDIAQLAQDDIEAAQRKWSCSSEAASYIVGLEKQVQFMQDACADLYRLVSPQGVFAKLIKSRAGDNEEKLCHADAHRHRRGAVRLFKPKTT